MRYDKIKVLIFILFFFTVELIAQPTPNHLHRMEQKDSLYYLLTDNSLFKFYSHESSGEFFLTKYIEGNFSSSTKLMLNDKNLFISYNDSIFYYLNRNPWELDFENIFVPGFSISSLHGFGPYFFIRSGNAYHLFKIVNGIVVSVEDSLFNYSSPGSVYFTYPFVIIYQNIYKYVEGFDFYLVSQISAPMGNTGITKNTLIGYRYWVELPPFPPPIEHSVLSKTVVEEPSFPSYIYNGWGYGIGQLHCNFCTGTLIAKENLYFMTWANVITTYNQQLAYLPNIEDRAMISDYYIFLLGNDSLRYSKWNTGSTFYPFTWLDWTSVEETDQPVKSFKLSQNYPNPFNPNTKIKYSIPSVTLRQAQSDIKVTLKVYDILGNEIATLVNEEKPAGEYEVEFNATRLPSGIYFYRLHAGDFTSTKKMILLK